MTKNILSSATWTLYASQRGCLRVIGSLLTGSLSALLAATLSGCGEVPTIVSPPPINHARCCTAYDRMTYETLTSGQWSGGTLKDGGPTHDFAYGDSYFAAFALPSREPRIGRLEFRVFTSFSFMPNIAAFHPHFVFLDADKKEIDHLVDPPVAYGVDKMALKHGMFFHGEVEIPDRCEFVVVYTSTILRPNWSLRDAYGQVWPVQQSMTGDFALRWHSDQGVR